MPAIVIPNASSSGWSANRLSLVYGVILYRWQRNNPASPGLFLVALPGQARFDVDREDRGILSQVGQQHGAIEAAAGQDRYSLQASPR